MIQHEPGVALYAALRLAVYEDGEGKCVVAYDRFTSILARYQHPEIASTAKQVEQKVDAGDQADSARIVGQPRNYCRCRGITRLAAARRLRCSSRQNVSRNPLNWKIMKDPTRGGGTVLLRRESSIAPGSFLLDSA